MGVRDERSSQRAEREKVNQRIEATLTRLGRMRSFPSNCFNNAPTI